MLLEHRSPHRGKAVRSMQLRGHRQCGRSLCLAPQLLLPASMWYKSTQGPVTPRTPQYLVPARTCFTAFPSSCSMARSRSCQGYLGPESTPPQLHQPTPGVSKAALVDHYSFAVVLRAQLLLDAAHLLLQEWRLWLPSSWMNAAKQLGQRSFEIPLRYFRVLNKP